MTPEVASATKFVFDKVGYAPTEAQKPIIYSDKRFILVNNKEKDYD